MSKILKDLTIEEIIKKNVDYVYNIKLDSAISDGELETDSDSVPYGNTWVSAGSYPTDRALNRFHEKFTENPDENLEEIVDYITQDSDFWEKIKEIIKSGDF